MHRLKSTKAQSLWACGLLLLMSNMFGCTLDDVYDEIRIVETIPAPGASSAPHRISRTVGLGDEGDRVEEGQIESVTISVLSPDDADLFDLLQIQIYVQSDSLLAEGTDFVEGERSRSLNVLYTDDIRPLLENSELTIDWYIYYKSESGGGFPAGGIELETVIGFNIDVELF